MTVELRPEDQAKLERLVSSGEFATIDDALHGVVEEFLAEEDWTNYASDRIEAGWADMQAGRTISGEEVHAWLDSLTKKRDESTSNTPEQHART